MPRTLRPCAPPRRLAVAATTCAAVLSLVACGGSSTAPVPGTPGAGTSTTAATVTIKDPWVKAAESGMTAVFGRLRNAGSTPVTVVSATTSASPRTELHEVVLSDGAMKMRPREGGFVIAGSADHELKPGGDHVMVMDLVSPIRPGDQVQVTLSLSDGSTTSFTALAKETSTGEENYDSGTSGGKSSMDKPGGSNG